MAVARPLLGEASAPEKSLITNVRARVAGWDKIASWSGAPEQLQPFYPGARTNASLATESVLNALILVNHDRKRNGGQLSDDARKALGIMWSRQNAQGSWDWLNFNLRPWELQAEYYGAALAAVTVGKAGKAYYERGLTAQEQTKLGKLRQYLQDGYANESLHNRLAVLWASTLMPGILVLQKQKELVDEVLSVNQDGDAWVITALAKKPGDQATWVRAHAVPTGTQYDGYATAFIVYVLKRARVSLDSPNLGSPKVEKATVWLVEQKVAEGKGPAVYLNSERDPESMVGKFMRDAAAAYAVLAMAGAD